ncbi:MAG: 3'-5' exonuclease [Butyrivibrio sp.]|nr:3'-5' exonuclease [Muribaculum sp.]MCM1552060.1 3'-5' exonuclease [Butyrivibrio sp.]
MSTPPIIDTYISIDLETTGLHPKQDKIIEIGALKVIDGQITETLSILVNPARALDEHIVQLTGIRDEQLRDAPYIEDVLPTVIDFLGDLPLLGHSILFDYSFLKKAAVDRKLSFEKNAIDTLKLARKYLTELEHRSLDYLCQYYKIEHHAHRALEDARATHFLYHKLAELFYEKEAQEGGHLFQPSPLHFQIKRDTPATKAQKEQLYRLLEQHTIVMNVDIERLTRSEASRWIDKIKSGVLSDGSAGG